MESEIRKIPKSKLRKIKEMSHYQIDEVVLLGFLLLNDKEVEENMDNQKLYNDFIQECYEFFERMSSKYDNIIETDSQRIDIKRVERKSVPAFNPIDYMIQSSPIREVSIKFNVFCDDEKLKSK